MASSAPIEVSCGYGDVIVNEGWAGTMWEVVVSWEGANIDGYRYEILTRWADSLDQEAIAIPGNADSYRLFLDDRFVPRYIEGLVAISPEGSRATTDLTDCGDTAPFRERRIYSTPSKVEVGKPVTFLATVTSTTAQTAWEWDFGDGMTSAEREPTHTFEAAGVYSVRVMVQAKALEEGGIGGFEFVEIIVEVF